MMDSASATEPYVRMRAALRSTRGSRGVNAIAAGKFACSRMRFRRWIVSSSTLVVAPMSSGIAQYAHSERSGRCSLAPQLGQWVLGGAVVDMVQ
jgi:hypothetical protein